MKYKYYKYGNCIVSEEQKWHFQRAVELNYINKYIDFNKGTSWLMVLTIGSPRGKSSKPKIFLDKKEHNNYIICSFDNVNINCSSLEDLIKSIIKICDLNWLS